MIIMGDPSRALASRYVDAPLSSKPSKPPKLQKNQPFHHLARGLTAEPIHPSGRVVSQCSAVVVSVGWQIFDFRAQQGVKRRGKRFKK